MEKFDIAIIGSGPAGCTAAIYTARSLVNTIVFSGDQPGGQLSITSGVENFPGFESIMGPELMRLMEKQAKACGAKFKTESIVRLEVTKKGVTLWSNTDKIYHSRALIIASGSSAKWLGLESEKFFLGSGVSACATCDGFFFRGKEVIVIGGGNTALEEATFLSSLCKKVTLIHRRDKLRGEPLMIERLKRLKNVEILYQKTLDKLEGSNEPKILQRAFIRDTVTGVISSLECDGCFIAIGHRPNTDAFKNQIELDPAGYIVVNPALSSATSSKCVFAAGDVKDKDYKQAITAAGFGCMAALDALEYLSLLD